MDRDAAQDYLGHNVEGAWVGDHTPIMVEVLPGKR